MAKQVKRAYRSSRRDEQARQTRARIRGAATELFVERGYAGTSVAAIAERAAVAPQTVFAVFGTKAALLADAIDVALAGDDRPVSLADRPESQRTLDAPSASDAAASFAATATQVLARAGRLIQVADAAAQQDPDLAPMWVAGHEARLKDMRRVARSFDAAGFLREGITVELAAELLWTLTSPDAYRSFVVLRGWSSTRYERWMRTAIQQALLR